MDVRLRNAALETLPSEVVRPAYDRAATTVGVLHFGPGAFHRAHQAFYFDRMLSLDPGLAISAVSLRSDDARAALEPQDGLFSLTERDTEPSIRVVGSVKEVLTAPRSRDAVLARLTDPAVQFVTATVTEKGYCLGPDGALDLDHPLVRADLAGGAPPTTLVGWLVEGLQARRRAGLAPFTVVSCDNLSGNGSRLHQSAMQLAAAKGERDLASWIRDEARFPDTMVDSITPATDAALRAEAAQRLGVVDEGPVQRERFVQWVVADELGRHAEVFRAAGVAVTSDVAAFERAKLRLLNGAHSSLAYLGLALGYHTVLDAMRDAQLSGFVERMMRGDAAAGLVATPGLEISRYIDQILARFRNPAIVHQLAQIASDGSQKLPVRLLQPMTEALAAGRPIDRPAVTVAAWMQYVRRQALTASEIVDPLAPELMQVGRACSGVASRDVSAFLALRAVFTPDLAEHPEVRRALEHAYDLLGGGDPGEALRL